MTARKGAEVAPINEKDLKEVLEIRRALESLACELACKGVQKQDIRKLQAVNDEISGAVEAEDIEMITKKMWNFMRLFAPLRTTRD